MIFKQGFGFGWERFNDGFVAFQGGGARQPNINSFSLQLTKITKTGSSFNFRRYLPKIFKKYFHGYISLPDASTVTKH